MFGHCLSCYEHFQISIFLTCYKTRETQIQLEVLRVTIVAYSSWNVPGKIPGFILRPNQTLEHKLCYMNSSHRNLALCKARFVGVYCTYLLAEYSSEVHGDRGHVSFVHYHISNTWHSAGM